MSSLQIPSHDSPSGNDDIGFDPFRSPSVERQDFNALPPMDSQAAAAALDNESHNFFDFLIAAIKSGEEADTSVTFATLLPPEEHRKDVAAQAFLHVLTLASKRLINAEQKEGTNDDIRIVVVGG